MADLTPLQQFGIWAGIAGFCLSLVNAIQAWRANRPRVSVQPDTAAGGLVQEEGVIEITIENPSAQAIMITQLRCWGENAHNFYPADRELRDTVRSVVEGSINWVIAPKAVSRFTFIPATDRGRLLMIFWRTNATLIFCRVPLFLLMTKRHMAALRHAGIARDHS